MLTQIPGFANLTVIYESVNSLVYRGISTQDGTPVIVKFLKEDYPNTEQIRRYQQEYEILCKLNSNGIVKAYSLNKFGNRLALILEDFGGESLKILMTRKKFSLREFLTVAIQITQSLVEVHYANIIHKDINPSNIALNSTTGQLKIIDFGTATILSRENPSIKSPNVLEGTLAYISPEQTGRMNRSLDYRTDFYSLGVTFYEILLAQLPFLAMDAMELVHCHIAKIPVSPQEISPNIPKAVSNIVMKLLSKTAEERYQGAWGLIADLEYCLNQLESTGEILEFPLGSQDISSRFSIPQKLYGREKEVATLLTAFDRVSQGSTEMMLVSGYSGIGKSALVQEIYKPITRDRGYFIAGKFDQFTRNIPYSGVVAAFQSLVRQILTESTESLNKWKEKLLLALDDNGQVIIDVIPEVELIIGSQPTVQELDPSEAKNRFNLVFKNFIKAFCQKEHPLVIFLDDLQWSDFATLKLFELIMTNKDTQHLFFIGAYRNNEVSPTHPLIVTLEGLRKEGTVINEITLRELELDQVAHLIADTLHKERESVVSLASLITRKTEGNPFFINEFLKSLYAENLLTFNLSRNEFGVNIGEWQWDITEIEAKGITDNVVELMIGKLKKLPNTSQQILQLAACIGNEFDLNSLSIIYKKSPLETYQELKPALEAELIIPTSELEITSSANNYSILITNYKFLHDRVQQAAYALIDESMKKAVHLEIGRLLLANTTIEQRSEKIFDLVRHLNMGRELIADEPELIQLSGLNLDAGKKAKDAAAYASALEYLKIGIECLGSDIWERHYELSFALYKERADAEYLIGNFEYSQELVDLMLTFAKSNIEKADLYNLLIIQFTLQAEYLSAIEAGRKALSLLGIDLPEIDLTNALMKELSEAKINQGEREISSLINLPEMTNLDMKMAGKLLNNISAPTFMSNQELYGISAIKIVNLSLKYGNIPESSLGYSCYGMLLAGFEDVLSGYEYGMLSVKLADKLHNLTQQAKSRILFASSLTFWKQPLSNALVVLNDGYQLCFSSGTLQFVGYALIFKSLHSFSKSVNLSEILLDLQNSLQYTYKVQNQWATDALLGIQIILLNLLGRTDNKFSFYNNEVDDVQHLENCRLHNSFAWICTYQILKTQVLYLYDRPTEAIESANNALQLIAYIPGQINTVEWAFYYSLSIASVFSGSLTEQQEQYWEQLNTNLHQMEIWAETCPRNFKHKYLLVAAEIARIAGEELKAIKLYDEAIQAANENGFIQDEALANELAGKFWLAKNKEEFAKIYLVKSYYGYRNWGAIRKVEDMENKYSQLLKKQQSFSIQDQITTTFTTTTTSSFGGLDIGTVLKASQAISGEIVLASLLAKLMQLVIENAGAEKGLLILANQKVLTLEASVDVNGEIQVMQSIPVSSSDEFPTAIINYVARTQENLLLSDATHEGTFTTDAYTIRNQPKSILCAPIINHGKLIAIVYLENNLTTGAFTPDRLEVLKILSSQAAISIENALLYQTLEQKVEERTTQLAEANEEISALNERLKAENFRMSAELDVTRRLQQIILPKPEELNAIESLDIAAFMEPADEVGGDYYDVLYQNGQVKIGIGDVTGHGLESGMIMIMTQMAVRTLLTNNETDSTKFLKVLNRAIYDNVNRMGSDKTLSLALLDYEEGTLRLSGQHEEMIVVRSNGEVELIDTIDLGFPIGLTDDIADFVAEAVVKLNTDDIAVLYTDGVTEAENIQGELYGQERIIEVVKTNRYLSAAEIKEAVIDDLRRYIGKQKIFDDITIVILKQRVILK